MSAFPKPDHTHSKCVNAAQRRFEQATLKSDKRTGVHVREIFDVLLEQHRAFSAYEIVEALQARGKKLRAIQVYRALEALLELGNIHRIESRNAYIACHNGSQCRHPQLLICESCDRVAEVNSDPIEHSINETADASGFVLQGRQVELFGLCPSCAA
ncbi:MAG: Fur family transcriptional regulator [Rhizobiaceae bacterium]